MNNLEIKVEKNGILNTLGSEKKKGLPRSLDNPFYS